MCAFEIVTWIANFLTERIGAVYHTFTVKIKAATHASIILNEWILKCYATDKSFQDLKAEN